MSRVLVTLALFIIANTLLAQEPSNLPVIKIGERKNPNPEKVILSGQILGGQQKEAIVGAVVHVFETNTNTVSDEKGKYELRLLPGEYTISITYLGYEDFNIQIEIYEAGTWDFMLKEAVVDLDEITISDRAANNNVTSVIGGLEQMSIEKIERQSVFLGEADVLRSLQSISGVSSVGEGAAGFNVRGGNADENLILQDDNLILNPVHALGFYSLFHPDLVDNVTLYKGGVPARYGGRLSSVLDVKLREGNNERFSIGGGLGLTTSRLAVEGPIIKNKSSFLVGARASYFDWILKQVKNVDLQKSQAFFYDITAKADARLSPSTKIGFTAFMSYDDAQFAEEVKFEYETRTASAYINQLISERVNLNLRLNIGQYQSTLFDIQGNDQSRFDNQIDYLRGSASIFFQISSKQSLEAGFEQNRFKILPGKLEPLDDNSLISPDHLESEKGVENSIFAQNQISLGDHLEFMIGLRYTTYTNLGPDQVHLYDNGIPKTEVTITESIEFSEDQEIISYSGFEPRLSLRWLFNDDHSLKLGYNRSYQFFSQISNTASATPIDIWQLSNYHLEPQKADNFSLGFYRNLRDNNFQLNTTVFYRRIDHLIDYKDFADLLLNEHIETELVVGKGKNYGLEFTLEKVQGRHRYEVNYTYSRSLRKIDVVPTQETVNAGKWYPSNYDKPHILNLHYFFQISDKSSLTLNFIYSTGRPTTAPISSYRNDNILTIPVYSQRNQFRIPDFHRLDFAFTVGPWGSATQEHSITFSIYNMYSRKNAFSVFFRQNPFQSVTAYRVAVLGSVFPAITYNFKF